MAVVATASAAFGATVDVADDGMLVVDGRRVFIVGLYATPDNPAGLRDAAVSGFNVVKAGRGSTTDLNRLWSVGLWGWATASSGLTRETPWPGTGSQTEGRAAVEDHPAFLLWEQPDEALWSCWWPALEWLRTVGPTRQVARLAALADSDVRRASLIARRQRADEAIRNGDLEAAEEIADSIWLELDGALPKETRSLRDAPACAVARAAELRRAYEALKDGDPCHPVWINHAPRNRRVDIEVFNQAADIVGCDIYPVPERAAGHSDLADQSMTAVGAYTRLMRAAAGGRPVFMVLQAFGWGDLEARHGVRSVQEKPAPSLDQMRFMTYDAIVRGARGVLFWGTRLYDRGSQLWADLCILGLELSEIQDVLAAPDGIPAPDVRLAASWTSEGDGVVVLPKVARGETWYIVVNENREPLEYGVCGIDEPDGTVYKVVGEDRSVLVHSGCLSLPIRGFGVHVLRRAQPKEPEREKSGANEGSMPQRLRASGGRR